MSWLPGTQSAVPASTIAITVRSTPGVSGPRSTRSPRNTALRPSRVCWNGAASAFRRSRAVPSSATSSSRQPWTSPMMSNGPCSSLEVVPQRLPLDLDRLDLLRRCSGRTRGGSPRPSGARSERRSCCACCRATCGPKSRSGRPRFRSWQSRSGRLSTIATGRQWNSRASSTSGLRASGCTFVASTTVSRPAASRLRAMK